MMRKGVDHQILLSGQMLEPIGLTPLNESSLVEMLVLNNKHAVGVANKFLKPIGTPRRLKHHLKVTVLLIADNIEAFLWEIDPDDISNLKNSLFQIDELRKDVNGPNSFLFSRNIGLSFQKLSIGLGLAGMQERLASHHLPMHVG